MDVPPAVVGGHIPLEIPVVCSGQTGPCEIEIKTATGQFEHLKGEQQAALFAKLMRLSSEQVTLSNLKGALALARLDGEVAKLSKQIEDLQARIPVSPPRD